MFSDKKVILFDLDGTLVDSAPDLALAVNHMLESLEREPFSHELIRSWVGNGAQTLVKRGLSGSSEINEEIEPELFEKALETFLNFYEANLCVDTIAYPNVLETLQHLKEENYRMVIVTNKPYDFVQPLLDGLGMDDIFEFCIGGDTLSSRKPDPMPLFHACERLGVSVEDCVMIGDSKNDIVAANAANMHSIGVSYGYNYGEHISLYEPNKVVDDFSQIKTLMAQSV